MSKKQASADRSARRDQRTLLIIVGAVMALLLVCSVTFSVGTYWLATSIQDNANDVVEAPDAPMAWPADSAELTVAASPVMEPVLRDLAEEFNRQELRTPDGNRMQVDVLPYEPEQMVSAALRAPTFQAMSPDSSLWLDRLEQAWATAAAETDADAGAQGTIPIGQQRVASQIRYAVSPIVIAAWEDAARELGWPEAVGWQDLQQTATNNPDFKWNHPSTSTAAGLLATLAEFYAGAGITRGLTAEAATAPETLAYVQAVESTVRFYGEGEEVIVERLAAEGRDFLDAFVGQERVVIDWNQTRPDEPLVAIYPAEGTLWTDHPLALLELGSRNDEPAVTENQRLTFQAFADFLTEPATQQQLLAAGYRPANLDIALDAPGSPFVDSEAVDWRQPQTTLQMPSPAVIDVVQDVWYLTKRPTNVYLVVDTSGSMEGVKIDATRDALASFVEQIRGQQDQIGMIEFGTGLKSFTPLRPMDDTNRADMIAQIDRLDAYGDTALTDAVYSAVADLVAQGNTGSINAIVVMTDGRENASQYGSRDVRRLLDGTDSPPVIFTIGFGRDADERLLRDLAEIGGGQFRRADETEIEELYRTISTYF